MRHASVQIGADVAGRRPALWRLSAHGLIIGPARSGKTTLAGGIARAADNHDTAIWVADPTTVDAPFPIADMIARGVEQSVALLHAAADHPRSVSTLVIVTDAGVLFADPRHGAAATNLAADIARRGRRLGVALVALAQDPWLPSLGNSTALRDGLAAGNLVMLRGPGDRHGNPLVDADDELEPGQAHFSPADSHQVTRIALADHRVGQAASPAR